MSVISIRSRATFKALNLIILKKDLANHKNYSIFATEWFQQAQIKIGGGLTQARDVILYLSLFL